MNDLRYAVRTLFRAPAFSAVALLTLTLGIGISTAIFSVVNGVLLKPVPFHDADRLVVVWETDRASGTTHEPSSLPDFLDFRVRSRHIGQFAAFSAGETNFTPDVGEPARVPTLNVSDGFFSTLGIGAQMGRTFSAEEDRIGGPPVVLISEALWTRAFARDPMIVGRQMRLDDRPLTIVGVLGPTADYGILQILRSADYSRGYADRDVQSGVDVFLPLRGNPKQLPRETHPLLVLGRLATAATLTSAQNEMTAIAADLEKTYPNANEARGVFIEPLRSVIVGPIEPALMVLLAAVGVVLLIACVNVTHLLLARGTVLAKEVAVRQALGAGGGRLLRQFAAESVVLTIVSAGGGTFLALGVLKVLLLQAPSGIPGLASVAVDFRVIGIMTGACSLIALVFSLVPIFQVRHRDVLSVLKAEQSRTGSGAKERTVARSVLVVGEIALAVVLVIGAGLLIKSFWSLSSVNPGFDGRGVVKAEFQLPASRYPINFSRFPNFPEIHRFNATLLNRVAALPGVESAAIAGNHPLDAGFTNSFTVVGRETESRDWPEISLRRVSAGYFRTVGVPLIRGRLIVDSDTTTSAPVVLVNEETVRRFFQTQDPLGQQISMYGASRTIVGVVGNERIFGLDEPAPIAMYMPLAQAAFSEGVVIARTAGDVNALAPLLREAVREVDSGLAVFGVEPLQQTIGHSMAERRFTMQLMTGFGGLALLLAVIGIHGLLSYTVAQRTRELGIRVALGAAPDAILKMVLRQSAWLTATGLAIGLALSLMLGQWLAGLLFGVTSRDAGIFAIVAAMLGAVALLATLIPAHRATRLDPVAALRAE